MYMLAATVCKLLPQGCNVPNLTMRKLAELLVIMVAGIIAGESLRREHVVQACGANMWCKLAVRACNVSLQCKVVMFQI